MVVAVAVDEAGVAVLADVADVAVLALTDAACVHGAGWDSALALAPSCVISAERGT